MKKPINPKELENDMNKILSFINNLENLDIKDLDQINKLKEQAELFDKKLKTKYKNYLTDLAVVLDNGKQKLLTVDFYMVMGYHLELLLKVI